MQYIHDEEVTILRDHSRKSKAKKVGHLRAFPSIGVGYKVCVLSRQQLLLPERSDFESREESVLFYGHKFFIASWADIGLDFHFKNIFRMLASRHKSEDFGLYWDAFEARIESSDAAMGHARKSGRKKGCWE